MISKQIGWSQESNLLWEISRQMEKLTGVVSASQPKYKVFTGLLTQSGGSVQDSINTGNLTIGVTYYIDDSSGGADFTNVGAPSNTPGIYFVATGTTPTWGTGGSNLVYDTGAPVVTVLENTIGNIWFTRNGTGTYSINSDGLFTDNKTAVFIGQSDFDNTGVASTSYVNGNSINITTYNYNGVLTNNILSNTSIEIRVY
jgi:hypothetical protein